MSNQINTTNGSNSTLVQISNNNVKYYEELAAQYASEAEKSVSACAVYLAAAQRCITECQNVLTEMETYISDELNLHLEDLDNPHEVTAGQTGAYTTAEVDALITELDVELDEIELSAEAAYTHSQLTSGNPHNVTAEDIGVYTTEQVDNLLENIDTSGIDLTGYVTEDELTAKLTEGGYLTAVPDEYVTETELTAKGYLTEVPDEYVTETELSEAISNIDTSEVNVDLSAYYTSDEVDTAIAAAIETAVGNVENGTY